MATQTAPTTRPTTIEKLGTGVFPSFAMLAGMQLDLFTVLKDGPRSTEQMSDALAVRPDKLRLLLYALVAAELLTVEDGLFCNTPEADHFLVRGKPAYLGGRHLYYRDRWNEALCTAESVRGGAPQAKVEFSNMGPEEQETFFRGLHAGTMATARDMVTRYDFSSYRTLLDVGGGSGGLAITVTEACPYIKATVVDLPEVTPITRRFIADAGASDRVEVMAADVIEGPLEGSFDLAVVRAFIQVLSPYEARSAIQNVSRVIKSGGAIYIIGTGILDNSRTSPPEAVAFNLVFLNIYDGGQAYTEEEHRAWLTEAGFTEGFERVTLPNGSGIIIARKPV